MLFPGVHVCTFRPGNFTGWSSEVVKCCPQILHHFSEFQKLKSSAIVIITAIVYLPHSDPEPTL